MHQIVRVIRRRAATTVAAFREENVLALAAKGGALPKPHRDRLELLALVRGI